MPGTATIVQSSVPKETPKMSSAEAERDVSSAESAKENKPGTNKLAPEILIGEPIMTPPPG
jgi:hypothetical protein